MLIKDNVTIGIEWRFGPGWPGKKCGAKTRRGTACQRPANKKNGRCRLHGGASTGPRTEGGIARISAANRAYAASNSTFLFPRYCDEKECHSNSASAALNKWLKQVAGSDYVIHSFRHSMRDRLRVVNCPSDMIDQIGGWSSGKIGEGYGEGYSLVRKWE